MVNAASLVFQITQGEGTPVHKGVSSTLVSHIVSFIVAKTRKEGLGPR